MKKMPPVTGINSRSAPLGVKPEKSSSKRKADTSQKKKARENKMGAKSIAADRAEIAKFVKVIFRHAEPGTHVSLRTFPQQQPDTEGEQRSPRIRTVVVRRDGLKNVVEAAFEEASWATSDEGRWVFCPPTVTFRDTSNAREANLANGLVLSVELDVRPLEGKRRLEKVLGKATLVIESGGTENVKGKEQPRLHMYWVLAAPTRTAKAHAQLKEARALATAISYGDQSNTSLVHPIRWPGSVHEKGAPRLCRIIDYRQKREIVLKDALSLLRSHRRTPMKVEGKKATVRASTEPSDASKLLQAINEGKDLHDSTMRLAMKLALGGVAKDTIIEILDAAIRMMPDASRGDPARWRERLNDIPRLVDTAIAKAATEAYWDDPDPLPTLSPPVAVLTGEMIPKKFRTWLVDSAARMQAPLDYFAVAALTAAGAVVGRQVAIQPKVHDTWIEHPNFWGCNVGQPSTLKSPAALVGMAPLEALEVKAQERNSKAIADYERAKREYDLRKKQLESRTRRKGTKADKAEDASNALGDPPPEPLLKRYVVVDATQESLGKIHAANPNGLLVNRDELGPFFKRLEDDKYASDRAMYLSGWTGKQSHTFDRIGRGHARIEALCISLFGSIQPERLLPYVKTASAGDGMIQRFGLLVWPDAPKSFELIDTAVDPNVFERVKNVFTRLSKLDAKKAGSVSQVGVMPVLKFSAPAQKTFGKWLIKLHRQQRKGGMPPALQAHLQKHTKLVPSLALLFHLIENKGGPIKRSNLNLAIRWGEYLASHAARAYGTVVRPDVQGANRIMKAIEVGVFTSGFSARDVVRKGWGSLTKSGEVYAALEVLVGCNIIRVRSASTGGRRAHTYDVNPKVRIVARNR